MSFPLIEARFLTIVGATPYAVVVSYGIYSGILVAKAIAINLRNGRPPI